MEIKTQLLVIGGGPGGYTAAFHAADKGLQVTIVDMRKNPGGVCTWEGCIPSKALLHISNLIYEAREAKKWGISYDEPKIDLDKLRDYKNSVISKLTGGLGQLAKTRKVNYVQGKASFKNSKSVIVKKTDGNEDEISFDNCIIATGSEPTKVPSLFFNSPYIIDSTGALELNDIPQRLLVVGGGYIGLELGTVYAMLGSKVTVVEMMPGLLPGADRDLVSVLAKNINRIMNAVYLETKVEELKEIKQGIEVKFVGNNIKEPVQVFDKVLISVGRKPVTSGLGLENTKVKINQKGFIEVNSQMKTDEANIYAIGDVVGNPMLAHKAFAEAKVAVESILGHKVAFEPNAIPAVVFTNPELAWTGITETEAKERGIKYEVVKFPWAASGKATSIDRNDGLTKLIIDPDTQRVLGVGIVGVGAGDMISEGTLAIEMAAVAKDIALTIHPHPTLSETISGVAEVFYGEAIEYYRPRKK